MPETTRYDCRKCGAVGSIPSHAMTCPAHDAGNLWSSSNVRRGRELLGRLDSTYVAEAAGLGALPVRIDLQAAIEAIRDMLRVIDAAAIGALI